MSLHSVPRPCVACGRSYTLFTRDAKSGLCADCATEIGGDAFKRGVGGVKVASRSDLTGGLRPPSRMDKLKLQHQRSRC